MAETAKEFIRRTDLIEKLEFLQGYVPQSDFTRPPQAYVEGLYEELQDFINELKTKAEA